MPYLKRKLDDAYEIHAGGAAANLFGANYRSDEPGENVRPRLHTPPPEVLLIE